MITQSSTLTYTTGKSHSFQLFVQHFYHSLYIFTHSHTPGLGRMRVDRIRIRIRIHYRPTNANTNTLCFHISAFEWFCVSYVLHSNEYSNECTYDFNHSNCIRFKNIRLLLELLSLRMAPGRDKLQRARFRAPTVKYAPFYRVPV